MDKLLVGLLSPTVANTLQSSVKLASAAVEPFKTVFDATHNLFERDSNSVANEMAKVKNVFELLDDFASGLQERISSLLDQHGIALKEPLELRRSPLDGRVEVFSDHPNRALLEGLINGDAEVSQDLKRYADLVSQISGKDDLELTLPPNQLELLVSRA